MKFSFVAVLAFVSAIVAAAEQDYCCLCDSCNAVPLSKEEIILLHNDESLGKTCGELELTMLDRADFTTEECASLRRNYEQVCCMESFEGIDKFEHESSTTKEQQHGAEANEQSSYLRAVRKLWQTTSWQIYRSSTTTNSRAPARTFRSTPQASSTARSSTSTSTTPQASSTARYSTSYSSGSSSWSSSWRASVSGSSFSSFSNGNLGASPSNTVNQQTGSQASAVSSSSASTTSTVSNGNVATTTSHTYSSEQSVTMVSDEPAVPCTYEPVGVYFPTAGGNFGFGICYDGSTPIAVAQGVSMWDPNLHKLFTGDCQQIDELSKFSLNSPSRPCFLVS